MAEVKNTDKKPAFNFKPVSTQSVYEVLDVEEPALARPVSRQEEEELSQTLKSLKLQKYEDKLREIGCESLEHLANLGETDLEGVGVPLGHKLKFMKKIKQLKSER